MPSKDIQLKSIHELGKPLKRFEKLFQEGETCDAELTEPCRVEKARVAAEAEIARRIRAKDPAIKLICAEEAWQTDATRFFVQTIKVALPNMPLQAVLDFVASGTLAAIGIYHKDLDITVDCAGTFRKHDAIEAMVSGGGFRLAGDAGDDADGHSCDKTIVQNDEAVGRNCLTYMQTVGLPRGPELEEMEAHAPKGLLSYLHRVETRNKGYNKTVNNFEKRKLSAGIGSNLGTWIGLMYDRVARSRDQTVETGYTRVESTIYADRPAIPIELAHLVIPRTTEAVDALLHEVVGSIPASQVLHTPHSLLWSNYVRNLKHSLVVVDSRYDRAFVVFTTNEVTNTVACVDVTTWHKNCKYVLQRLALGCTHTDLVTIHRGRDYTPPEREARKKR